MYQGLLNLCGFQETLFIGTSQPMNKGELSYLEPLKKSILYRWSL